MRWHLHGSVEKQEGKKETGEGEVGVQQGVGEAT